MLFKVGPCRQVGSAMALVAAEHLQPPMQLSCWGPALTPAWQAGPATQAAFHQVPSSFLKLAWQIRGSPRTLHTGCATSTTRWWKTKLGACADFGLSSTKEVRAFGIRLAGTSTVGGPGQCARSTSRIRKLSWCLAQAFSRPWGTCTCSIADQPAPVRLDSTDCKLSIQIILAPIGLMHQIIVMTVQGAILPTTRIQMWAATELDNSQTVPRGWASMTLGLLWFLSVRNKSYAPAMSQQAGLAASLAQNIPRRPCAT